MNYFSASIVLRFSNQQPSADKKIGYDFCRILGLAVFMLVGLTVTVRAQTAPQLSVDDRTAALKSIKEKFQTLYVIPEMRPAIIDRLNKAQQAGRYDVNDPTIFAE